MYSFIIFSYCLCISEYVRLQHHTHVKAWLDRTDQAAARCNRVSLPTPGNQSSAQQRGIQLVSDDTSGVGTDVLQEEEWSTVPVCPCLMCFFNRGSTEGTNSLKILCLMFVYVLFYINLCQD